MRIFRYQVDYIVAGNVKFVSNFWNQVAHNCKQNIPSDLYLFQNKLTGYILNKILVAILGAKICYFLFNLACFCISFCWFQIKSEDGKLSAIIFGGDIKK
jgi:prolipoprotein diacylglyceryltransferase